MSDPKTPAEMLDALGKPFPRYDEPLTQRQRDELTPADAFWLQVEADSESECWLWRGNVSRRYGRTYAGGKYMRSHRYVWELINGPIPDGMVVCHRCDTPLCVRPDHLFVATTAENNADRAAKGRSAQGDNHPSRLYPERRPRGEGHGMAKYTAEQIRKAKALIDAGTTLNQIARLTGISKYTLSKVKRGIQWTSV